MRKSCIIVALIGFYDFLLAESVCSYRHRQNLQFFTTNFPKNNLN